MTKAKEMKYIVQSTNHEYHVLSWWAATTSGTDLLEMVFEESGHRIVWGLRAGSPPVLVGKTSVSVRESGNTTVGLYDIPARLFELELCLAKSTNIERVLSEARTKYKHHFDKAGAGIIDVWYTRKSYDNVHWRHYGSIPNRPITSVSLAGGLEHEVLADAKRFLDPETEAEYTAFGRPYKRVYCLHGPPGTGKTSLIVAIASELGRPVAIFNVDSLRDDTFIELLSDLPKGAVVMFEDVDAMFKTRVKPQTKNNTQSGSGPEDGGMTFSTLLNALDGVLHPRGTIVFMTTNHVDRLDPALHRPGRVDRMIEVPLARSAQVAGLWKTTFPNGPAMPPGLARAADAGKGVSPALTAEVLFRQRSSTPTVVAAALLAAWSE
jgi:hypothetical protein